MRRLGVALALALGVGLAPGGSMATAQTVPFPFEPDREARQLSVTVTPDRRSMRGLSPSLRTARAAMHAGETIADQDLARLAEAGDGLAAQTLARRLVAQPEADPSDVAYYSALAVMTGRVWTLPQMVRAMRQLTPGQEPSDRVRAYIRALYPHAWEGNTLALDAVVAFNGEGRLFGALSDRTRERILERSARDGEGRAELRLAVARLEAGVETAQARAEVRALLERAEASTHLGIRTAAQNLIARLDRNDTGGG
ncbi:MAG: hypothetical protein AAGB05_07680 [Pseudomonadota bacterium]